MWNIKKWIRSSVSIFANCELPLKVIWLGRPLHWRSWGISRFGLSISQIYLRRYFQVSLWNDFPFRVLRAECKKRLGSHSVQNIKSHVSPCFFSVFIRTLDWAWCSHRSSILQLHRLKLPPFFWMVCGESGIVSETLTVPQRLWINYPVLYPTMSLCLSHTHAPAGGLALLISDYFRDSQCILCWFSFFLLLSYFFSFVFLGLRSPLLLVSLFFSFQNVVSLFCFSFFGILMKENNNESGIIHCHLIEAFEEVEINNSITELFLCDQLPRILKLSLLK